MLSDFAGRSVFGDLWLFFVVSWFSDAPWLAVDPTALLRQSARGPLLQWMHVISRLGAVAHSILCH